MEKGNQVVTLKQIAELAGTSIGTVDRVLHNRGKVSADNLKKINAIIKELGYEPNVHASLLSSKKNIRIGVIIPYFQSGDFWSLIYDGIQKSRDDYKSLSLTINYFYYNQFDPDSFQQACRQCEDTEPNGVLISPVHKELTVKFVNRVQEKGIEIVFVDTPITDCDYLTYYGINMKDSGKVAADLLFKSGGKIRKVANFLIDKGGLPQNESFIQRADGINEYIRENKLNVEIIDCMISSSDFLSTISIIDEFFATHPDIHHAITTTSRSHLISDWMDIRGRHDITLVGYDMTTANLKALRKGSIYALISERTDMEANKAAKALIEYLAFNKRPSKKDNLFPIDILTRYNVQYYL